MPLNTFGVVSAVTPSVIETYFSHFLHRAPLRQKPTAHISYHEGLRLIRQFLDYSAKHTVEDLQAFTAQWVPTPTWVRVQDVDIKLQHLELSARLIRDQLGPKGIDLVGGKSWWEWRRPDAPCKAEWIEMKKDHNERKRLGVKPDRAMLYVHGGAYFFGSVDEHRYQIQRHARKLKARVFAPRYRLAPQFPFPCGLQDCIAAYFQLLEEFEPSQILFAGDSAGGGMVLSMLVTLRDQGQPLPAGTILLSPWVDLTHSFPSVSGDGAGDYIPPHGFHHKPSMVWPPPNTDELRDLAATPIKKKKSKDDLSSMSFPDQDRKVPHADRDLSLYVNGERITIKDQIQMYSTNHMLAHPLVSPVQQPSLGGLPPMLIQVGGSELLRDEQIYLAHKAANPMAYPPSESIMNEYGARREDVGKYPPTDVQLQVWDDLCHVPHTLSFTRPAKYMYRAVAQFGAWALAHAQHKPIPIMDDDQISIISSGPATDNEENASTTNLPESAPRSADQPNGAIRPMAPKGQRPNGAVGKAGSPIPPFKDHMIRQRVDRHGVTYTLPPESEIVCLHLDPESIGAIKPGPVGKWLTHKRTMDSKFSSEKKKVQKKRLKEIQAGYQMVGEGEYPPPTALAGRRTADMPPEKRLKKSWGLAMWSGWGWSHDEHQIEREEQLERAPSVRPDSRQPSSHGNHRAPETAGFKPFGSAADYHGRNRGTSGSSIFSDRSKPDERSVSPFVNSTDEVRSGHQLIGGSNLRPPSAAESHDISRTSSRRSVTPSQRDVNPTTQPTAATDFAQSQQHISADSDNLAASSRVHSPPNERVISPTNEAVSERSDTAMGPRPSQDVNRSNTPDGPIAYPFKIRNPVPGYTSSVASSSNGDPSESQTSSTLFPPAGSNGVPTARTHLARPISSVNAFSDKEIVMPTLEKEVTMDTSNPGTPTDGRSMPFRMRNAPNDSRVGVPRLEANNSLTTVPTNTSVASSIPASPSASYRGKAPDFHHRNPVFDPRAVAARVFGGGSQSDVSTPSDQMRAPAPPKPVGFAYNPRDLRNAMLNRAAAENAAASASRGNSPAPASPAPSQPSQPFGGAVELPAAAVVQSPSRETLGRGSPASETSKSTANTATTPLSDFKLPDPKPVELADTPSTAAAARSPIPPSPLHSSSSSFSNRPDLAVRENITMPVVETPRNSHPPPPVPPKDEPAKSPPLGGAPPTPSKQVAKGKERAVSPQTMAAAAAAPPRVQESAPVIGEIPGLRGESSAGDGVGEGLDFGLGKGQEGREGKAPAWL